MDETLGEGVGGFEVIVGFVVGYWFGNVPCYVWIRLLGSGR